jgi:hypothetical protein
MSTDIPSAKKSAPVLISSWIGGRVPFLQKVAVVTIQLRDSSDLRKLRLPQLRDSRADSRTPPQSMMSIGTVSIAGVTNPKEAKPEPHWQSVWDSKN